MCENGNSNRPDGKWPIIVDITDTARVIDQGGEIERILKVGMG